MGQFSHASTMDPPDDGNVVVFDLNNISPTVIDLNNISPTVIDLIELQRPLLRIHRNKGKKVASPTSNSPRSSKRGSKGEEIMVGLTNTFYEIKDQLQSTMVKSSTSSSVGNVCPNTGRPRDWVIEAMNIINTLDVQMALPTHAQRNACTTLKGIHEANVFVHMTDAIQRDWLMGFLSPDNN
jgi:hypothetical protein